MKHTNWRLGSSRRNRSTWTMSGAATRIVSSPNAISAPSSLSPSLLATCASMIWSASRASVVPGVTAMRAASALDRAGAADLPLQEEHAVEQSLRGRRAARHVNVHRHDAVAAAHDRVGIVVVAAAVGAGAHGD